VADPIPRRLIRARDLAAFRDALIGCALDGPAASAARRVVVVPTRAAAELLRQTVESRLAAGGAVVLPALVTRDEWMARLHRALPRARRLLTRIEREVLMERAARATAARARMRAAPFHLRPGLVSSLLDFHDELGRRGRSIRRFARVLFDQLRVERGTDRGSEGLIHQTAFMGLTFLAFERAVRASDGIDEHLLRRDVVQHQPVLPFDHLVIAVADHPSDPRGLWPADFELISRLRRLRQVDVVVTDETHDAGFRDRIERELPGIVEVRVPASAAAPHLVRPPALNGAEPLCFVSRDREDELRRVARHIRARAVDGLLAERVAVVFHRPLPYLYLAQQVMTDAHVPYEAFDALPLAGEPYAATLDLVMAFARTGGTRESASALLRTTQLGFAEAGEVVTPEDVSALEAALIARRAPGEADTYEREVAAWFSDRPSREGRPREAALRAARSARAIREELQPFRSGAAASTQVRGLSSFLRRHERLAASDAPWTERQQRARQAILGVLDELAAAFARHDDAPRPDESITAAVRHAIEGHVFTPRRGSGGVHVVDAAAARFGAFDHAHLVGLVETDWPERPPRNIFFTTGLLKSLGWTQEPDDLRAQQAAFRDLLRLPARTVTLHAFDLEGDTIVARSPMVESARVLPAIEVRGDASAPLFADEVLPAVAPEQISALEPGLAEWWTLRRRRPPLAAPQYHGRIEPQPARAYRVSAVDRYVDCPFKYFGETVLRLPEERDETAGLTPLERGTLIHDLFEQFYTAWQAQGEGTITPATLPRAVGLFAELTRTRLAKLPEADRALEETRLLGSIFARGVAERVFELEADAGGRIVRRLLEYELRGPFPFPQLQGLRQRVVEIRGKADRIDVFADDSLRVVDYKLSALPDLDSSVQVAVYAHAARHALERAEQRRFTIGAAMYLAFGDDRHLEGKLGGRDVLPEMAVSARASAFVTDIDRIEAGEFPARPRRPGECQWCGVAGVCRKEYATDRDEAAESV
jgi:RecB family exonuclease